MEIATKHCLHLDTKAPTCLIKMSPFAASRFPIDLASKARNMVRMWYAMQYKDAIHYFPSVNRVFLRQMTPQGFNTGDLAAILGPPPCKLSGTGEREAQLCENRTLQRDLTEHFLWHCYTPAELGPGGRAPCGIFSKGVRCWYTSPSECAALRQALY